MTKTEEFIQKAKLVHGDKYDYSLVDYKNCKTKIKIICKKHGIFEQTPEKHLGKCGCQKCSKVYRIKPDEFIQKAKLIHNDKYDYSKVEYVNKSINVIIICPEHGEFKQLPEVHLRPSGCPKCVGKNKTSNDFINDAKKIHSNKYDYSLVNYVNNITKIRIICPIHGIFEQVPAIHLTGCGCPNCGGTIQKTNNNFINDAKNIHSNKYDYSLVDYKNSKTKVKIICPVHGIFEQVPSSHLIGRGCPKCVGQGLNYLSFEDSRIFVRNLNLKSKTEWVEYCKFDKLPDYIPNRPDHVYKYNGWINWGDWLGFYYRQYLSIEEFKKFIKDTFPNIPPGIELRKAYESWWDENKPDYLPKNVSDYYNK